MTHCKLQALYIALASIFLLSSGFSARALVKLNEGISWTGFLMVYICKLFVWVLRVLVNAGSSACGMVKQYQGWFKKSSQIHEKLDPGMFGNASVQRLATTSALYVMN